MKFYEVASTWISPLGEPQNRKMLEAISAFLEAYDKEISNYGLV